MKRPWIAGLLAVAVLPVLAGGPVYAEAQGATSLVCTMAFPAHFAPGFTLTPKSGTDRSAGEVGTLACSGTQDGHRVTGAGTFGFEGVYTSDCLFDHGSGTYFYTLPTDAGPVHATGTYAYDRIGVTLFVAASQSGSGAHGSATLLVVPTKGDCVFTPFTEALVVGTLLISPGA